MLSERVFAQRLLGALSHYHNTIDLIDELLAERRAAQEIVLLACGRLDSLANLAFHNIPGQQESFRRFVANYSGQKSFFHSISVGDLYRFLIYYADLSDGGLINVPGRVKRLGSESDIFLAFIENSGVPITGESVRNIANRVAKILKKQFRVKPGQRLSKPHRSSPTKIYELISQEFRMPDPDKIINSLAPLLDYFKCSSILYRNYRNRAVHGLMVEFDEDEFFEDNDPFHSKYENYFGEVVLQIAFPGKYLRDLLAKCLETYTNHIIVKKNLPSDLFNSMFSMEEILESDVIDYLEEDSLDEFEDVRWHLKIR
jgi:hypothetical protein